jgi:hypothetical protein
MVLVFNSPADVFYAIWSSCKYAFHFPSVITKEFHCTYVRMYLPLLTMQDMEIGLCWSRGFLLLMLRSFFHVKSLSLRT